MKRQMADFIKENTRAYQYYFKAPGKYKHLILSIIAVGLISVMIFFSRMIFLERYFLFKAGTEDLGLQEVREWVGIQVTSRSFDGSVRILMGGTIITIVYLLIVYTKVKGYNLYKMQKRFILPPVVLYAAMAVVIIVYERENVYLRWLVIQIAIDMLPILSAFKIFLPLDMRKSYELPFKIFNLISNKIIEKL